MTKDTSDRAWMLNAVVTGCATVIWFRLPDPHEAEFAARHTFLSHLDYAEWKPGTERPVVTGHQRETVRNSSHSDMHGEHSMEGRTQSSMRGLARGTSAGRTTASGSATAAADLTSYVMTPPLALFGPNADNAAMIPTILGQTAGATTSESSFEQESQSFAETEAEMEAEGDAETAAYGTNSATTSSEGESETFVPILEWMPSQLYSLPEQLARAAAIIQSLPPREVVIKAGGAAPVRGRTTDLPPAFKSPAFKAAMLPVFARACAERSPYLLPIAEVDALIAARSPPALRSPAPPPDPNFSPVPLPIVDAPIEYGRAFLAARKKRTDTTKSKKSPRGRRPVGDHLDARHGKFTIIDSQTVDSPKDS